MLNLFRGEDVACRYGGDEFTIVLSEASLADTWRRAEQLREAVKRLDLKYEGVQIGPITLSIGVAAYPDHGLSAERVLLASDAASYASKSEGGDRIMMGRIKFIDVTAQPFKKSYHERYEIYEIYCIKTKFLG